MSIQPTLDAFSIQHKAGNAQLVWMEKPEGSLTPTDVADKLQEDGQPFFILESVEEGSKGRYSVIGIAPDLIWKADESGASISRDGQPFEPAGTDVLASCRELVTQTRLDLPEGIPPMSSGLIGYLSYDSIRLKETTIPDNNPAQLEIPLGVFMRPTVMVIFDHQTDTLYLTTSVWDLSTSASSDYDAANARLASVWETIETGAGKNRAQSDHPTDKTFQSNMSKEDFCTMIESAKDYILAGDVFQVVPSQRFQRRYTQHPFLLYQQLRDLNPSPFMFYLDMGDFQLVGASPEIMVRVRDDKVTIRPLAGTRKRGQNKAEDDALAQDLLSDSKEISEHLMLVDLSRNDVGRVSQPGTVKLIEEMMIEYYSHVMHISSTVQGDMDPKYDAIDALFSGLPVGTVSGAPKVRAMQLIDELEPDKREFYAGCVGYFSADGSMETCITLRTGLIKDQTLYVQAGCGVVAESDPESEYQETLNKAAALFKAAEASEK